MTLMSDTAPETQIEFRMEFDVEEDVEGELEDFVQYARMGLDQEARNVFQQNLKPHLELFPVLAEYAEFLLATNAYEELLQIIPPWENKHKYSDAEWWLLRLLHDLAEGHTTGQFTNALRAAQDWRIQTRCELAELDDVDIQCYEVYLSILLVSNKTLVILDDGRQFPDHEKHASEWQRLCNWSLMLLDDERRWEAQKIINLLFSFAPQNHETVLLQNASLRFRDDNSDSAMLTKAAIINHYVMLKLNGSPNLAPGEDLESLQKLTADASACLHLLFAESTMRGRHFIDCNYNEIQIKNKEKWIIESYEQKKREEKEKEEMEFDEMYEERVKPEFLAAGYSEFEIEHIIKEQKDKKQDNHLAIEHARPTRIRVHRGYLATATLEHYNLPWEYDGENSDYVVINKYIDHDLQNELFEHTKGLKNRKLLEEPKVRRRVGLGKTILSADGSTKFVLGKKMER